MITIGNYLLQMSCWLAAFWLTYTLVLKKETYFHLNRWFLNLGITLSLLMPLIPLKYNVQIVSKPIVTSITQTQVFQSIESNTSVNYWLIAYALGALFFIGRFVIQHFRLYQIRKRSASVSIDSLKVYQIEKETAPFSFFNQIYVSSTLSSDIELKTIVAHEKVHIIERHWADLLLLEVARAIQWFNPLLQLYRKAIMQNHEFLADSGTIDFGVSARTYKAILANQMLGVPVVSYASSFTLFDSNNRILMMNKDKSTPIKRLKILLILPLISIILVGFAKPNYVSEQLIDTSIPEGTLKISGKVMDKDGEALPGASIIVANTNYGTVANMKGEFILDAVKPTDNIVVSFVGYETIVSPVKKEMNIKMDRNVVQIEVRQEESVPPPPPPPPAAGLEFRSNDGKVPLIVIDDKISNIDINEIDPNSIQSINVLKDQSAIDKYGKKAADGVIEISTKKVESRISPDGETFIVVEDMPQYPGGAGALENYVRVAASKVGLAGKASVTFIVDAKGEIQDARVIKSTSEELKAPALKIVNAMSTWKPGMQRGKPVKVSYTIVIEF